MSDDQGNVTVVKGYGQRYHFAKVLEAANEVITLALETLEPTALYAWAKHGRPALEHHARRAVVMHDAHDLCLTFIAAHTAFGFYPCGVRAATLDTRLGIFVAGPGESIDHVDPMPMLKIGTTQPSSQEVWPGLTQKQVDLVVAAMEKGQIDVVMGVSRMPCRSLPPDVRGAERLRCELHCLFPHQVYGDGEGPLQMVWDGRTIGPTSLRQPKNDS